jgi:hypothetical protein
MTQQVKLCYRNILENSTVAVTTENSSFPKYRLHDRDIGKLFKATAYANPFSIILDQGAVTSYEVDRLLIPAGHNLSGLACSLRYSIDNFVSDDHEAIGWTQGDALLIDKSFTAQTKRYWKLNITAPATIVEIPEMYLTKQYTFQRNPSYGLEDRIKRNISRWETQSGRVRRVKNGDPRRARRYDLTKITGTQKTEFESWESVCEGIKYFYIEDINGVVFFAELIEEIFFRMENEGRWGTTIDLLEVL